MSRGDEIDELVSSVRSFVAHKESQRMPSEVAGNKLILSANDRLSDDQVKAIDAEWEAEIRALEEAGIVERGKGLELTIAELEEAVANLPEDWEPGQPVTNVSNALAERPLQLGGVEETAPTLVDVAALEEIIVSKMGDLIDQDALRALVVKTVHEELSGELGERITRNVRKLVRREINRVMTSRDLNGD